MTMDMDRGRAIDMGFMYRTPDMGSAGEAGRVMVEDIEPMTVVTVGVRGRVEGTATDEALAELRHGWPRGRRGRREPAAHGLQRSERAASPPVLRGADPGAPDRALSLRVMRMAGAAAHPGAQRPHHGQPIRRRPVREARS